MKSKIYNLLLVMALFQRVVLAQTCPAPVVPAADLINVIANPGFETGAIAPGNAGPHALVGCCSSPGTYMISNLSNNFNAGLIQGITPHSGTRMLMLDGVMASNAIAWEQTVTVQPNKMYYFSAWLTALSSVEKSQMIFQVQPVAPVAGVSVAISAYFIPPNGPIWQQQFGTWFSGSTTSVTIRLINTNPLAVGGSGNDYAIDDLVFRPTCVGTTAGPKPNLGPSILGICNSGGKVDLNSNVPNQAGNKYTWFRNGNLVSNTSTPDILEKQTVVGTYVVCLDSGGCVKSDTVQLQAVLSLDLGPDLDLCNPSFKLLDTRITAPDAFTIEWYKNNVLIPSATSATYMVTAAGTYSVVVTDGASCSGTDEIVITSQVDETIGDAYCVPDSSSATVSVVDAGGIYTWYDAPTGGSFIGTGLTYNVSGLTGTGTYTYYVENSKPVISGAGLLNNSSPYLGPGGPTYGGNNVHAQNQMIFSANMDATLTSVTVILDMNANYAGNVTITLEDKTVANTVTSTYPISNNPGAAGAKSYPIPLSLPVISGHTYWLSILGVNGSSFTHRYTGANISTYFPASYTAVTLLSGQANTIYPGLFDWKFSSPSSCARVPALVLNNCKPPVDTTVVPPTPSVELYIPNLVTPNGDSKNDTFTITGLPDKSSLSISNRWGQSIYESSNYDNLWVENSDGVYYYYLTLPNGKSYRGWVQLMH